MSGHPQLVLEQNVIQSLIQLQEVIRDNNRRNCANVSNACNYKDPTEFFGRARTALQALVAHVSNESNPFQTRNNYVDVLAKYNELITYAMHPSEPTPDLPLHVSTVTETPLHAFLASDTAMGKINVVKSTLFGYN